jgi:hypothetical protein
VAHASADDELGRALVTGPNRRTLRTERQPAQTDEHFCTYFDHRYAAKGLAMWRSLKQHRPSAALHVLCLDQACYEILAGLQLPDVHLCSLKTLEDDEPDLHCARGNRTLVEYYFTVTPCLPLYIFKTRPDVTRLTYVDADLFFFADPQPIFDEVADDVVGLIEHRFPDELADLVKHGRFNVGWLTFRRDSIAISCLQRWRGQCIEWCYDRLEPDRFAEQKYLDRWPSDFERVHIIEHRGANVAPWNLNRFEISVNEKGVAVGGDPLLFYHAHGFRPESPGHPRLLNLETYHVAATPLLSRVIFQPYERALVAATAELATPLAMALLADDQFRDTTALLDQLSLVEADRAARLRVIGELQTALDESNADRAARLDLAHRLHTQLDASEADRAARLEMIGRLQTALDESNADRAARLDLAHRLQAQLDTSEADRAARLEMIGRLQTALDESNADRAARLDLAHRLQAQLDTSEADRAARLEVITRLQTAIDETNADRAAHMDLAQRLQAQLDASESDRVARLDVIARLEMALEESNADRAARLDLAQRLQAQLDASESDRVARLDVIQELHAKVEAAAADVESLRTKLEQARLRIAEMERSQSWRWTRPIRWVSGMFTQSRSKA